MKIVTAEQMRQIESRAAEEGISSAVLMENAGFAVANELGRLLGRAAGYRVLILVGPGNNGGDGLVAARHLDNLGVEVYLYLCGQRSDADPNLRLARDQGITCFEASADEGWNNLGTILSLAEVVVDALLGTGKLRPIQGMMEQILAKVKMAKEERPQISIVALDLPSGLDADTGAIDPACLAADVTITLGYSKPGLFVFPASEIAGRLIIADIGIPPKLAEDIPTELITAEWVRSMLPKRPRDAYKGTFGKVLVAAGSINYIGAAYLACAAATRVGAGLVTLATTRSLLPILASKLTEVTYLPLPESEPGIIHAEASAVLRDGLSGYDVLLLGCGLGQSPPVTEFIKDCLFSPQATSLPALVLDADALNTLAKTPDWWHKLSGDAVLTPHPGEMARLTGTSIDEIQSHRLTVARQAAADWQRTVVLKGAYTVVASSDGQAKLSAVTNPGLASAGTGDVLAGVIAGLIAQGLSPFMAAGCGVYLHAAAGELVRNDLGDEGMVASDLLPALPLAIKKLKESYITLILADEQL